MSPLDPDIRWWLRNDADRHQRSFDDQRLERLQCILNSSFSGSGQDGGLRRTGYAQGDLAL